MPGKTTGTGSDQLSEVRGGIHKGNTQPDQSPLLRVQCFTAHVVRSPTRSPTRCHASCRGARLTSPNQRPHTLDIRPAFYTTDPSHSQFPVTQESHVQDLLYQLPYRAGPGHQGYGGSHPSRCMDRSHQPQPRVGHGTRASSGAACNRVRDAFALSDPARSQDFSPSCNRNLPEPLASGKHGWVLSEL